MALKPRDIGQVATGRVRPAPSIPGSRRTTGLQPLQTVEPSGFRAIGALLGDVRKGADALLNQELRREAKEAASEAERQARADVLGASDIADIAMPIGTSIAEEAYRRTAQNVAQIRLETVAYDTVNQLADEYGADPAAFRAQVTAAMKGQLSSVDEAFRPQVLATWQQLGRSRLTTIEQRRRDLDIDDARATILGAHDRLRVEAARVARSGDLDMAFDVVDRLASLYGSSGPVEDGGTGVYTDAQIADLQLEAMADVRQNYVMGWAERVDDPTAALDGLMAGDVGDDAVNGVLEQMAPAELASVERALQSRISADEAAWNAYEKEVGRDTAAAIDLMRDGVLPAGLDDTFRRAQGTEHAEELQLAAETFDALGPFPGMRLGDKVTRFEQLNAEIAELADDSPAAMERQAELVRRRDMMESQIAADREAIESGGVLERFAATVQEAPPIDFTARSWAIRASHADHVASHYGVAGVDLLTSDEADQFTAVLDEAPSEQRLAIMQEASTALDDAAGRLWSQVAHKRPDYARIGQLLVRGVDRRTVRDATLGADILASDDGKTIAMPTAADRQYMLQQVAGEALHEAVPQEFVNGVMAVADGIYAARSRASGNVAAYDQARYRRALEEAIGERENGTGGVGSVNGRRVLLPAGWTAREMNALIGDMTADAWQAGSVEGGMPVYGTGDPVEIDDLRGAELVAVNPLKGQFMVMTSGGVVLTPSGSPYVLDVEEAQSVVEREQGAAGEQRRVIGERFPPGPGVR